MVVLRQLNDSHDLTLPCLHGGRTTFSRYVLSQLVAYPKVRGRV